MVRQYNLLSFTDTNSVICKIIVGAVTDRPRAINNRPYKTSVKKGERYMKATVIVRRVEVCPIEHKGVKIGFSAVFIHSKQRGEFPLAVLVAIRITGGYDLIFYNAFNLKMQAS